MWGLEGVLKERAACKPRQIEIYREMLAHVRECLAARKDIDGRFNRCRKLLLSAPEFVQTALDYKSDGYRMLI